MDPNFSKCRRVRFALYFMAEYFTHEFNSNGSLPLFCTISRPSSIVCLQRYGHRPAVNIKIEIRTSTTRSPNSQDLARVNLLRGRLEEIGIRER